MAKRKFGSLVVKWYLEVVEAWAEGYWMIQETGIVTPRRRLDALLVPVTGEARCMKRFRGSFWKRVRLLGVEVKISRQDFLKGLKSGQFDHYDKHVSGLYVVVPMDENVGKMSELPPNVGFIEIEKSGPRAKWICHCRRHPKFKDIEFTYDVPWRLLFQIREEYQQAVRDLKARYDERYETLKNEVDCTVHHAIRKIEKKIIVGEKE